MGEDARHSRVSRLTTDECAQGAAIVAHSVRAGGFDASEDGTGRGVPLVAGTLKANGAKSGSENGAEFCDRLIPLTVGALTDGAHMGGGLTARTPTPGESSPLPEVAWALQERDAKGADSSTKPGHLIPVGGGFDAPIPLDPRQVTSPHNRSAPTVMAVALRGREGGGTAEVSEVPSALRASGGGGDKAHILTAMQVRRLTPRECERLQGFPDDYTLVPVRGKPAADGPRYRALGNSMAVNCMRWIGERIDMAMASQWEAA